MGNTRRSPDNSINPISLARTTMVKVNIIGRYLDSAMSIG